MPNKWQQRFPSFLLYTALLLYNHGMFIFTFSFNVLDQYLFFAAKLPSQHGSIRQEVRHIKLVVYGNISINYLTL